LESYAACASRLGSRLYIPVELLREEIGHRLSARGFLLTDSAIDRILRHSPLLLAAHQVAFSPFSGPSRAGVSLPNMYAGFISIRPKSGEPGSSRRAQD
jgi:hypothetical protein